MFPTIFISLWLLYALAGFQRQLFICFLLRCWIFIGFIFSSVYEEVQWLDSLCSIVSLFQETRVAAMGCIDGLYALWRRFDFSSKKNGMHWWFTKILYILLLFPSLYTFLMYILFVILTGMGFGICLSGLICFGLENEWVYLLSINRRFLCLSLWNWFSLFSVLFVDNPLLYLLSFRFYWYSILCFLWKKKRLLLYFEWYLWQEALHYGVIFLMIFWAWWFSKKGLYCQTRNFFLHLWHLCSAHPAIVF